MKLLCGRSAALLFLLSLAQACQADESPYQDLLRRLPDSTNVIVVADVQGLRKSLGVPPGTSLMAADISNLPVMAKTFVFGAHVDLGDRRHLWSVALAQLGRKVAIQDIATLENEPLDEVAGQAVVPTPRNAYFVDLGPNLLGCATPANRQQLQRWLGFQKNNPLPVLSPYLLQAANPADPALIVLAADLADSLAPTAIRRGLQTSQVMNSRRKPDYDAVARTLTKVKGITLTVRAGNPLQGDLTVDFNTDTVAIRDFGKSLLLEILERNDLLVSDFNSWEPRLNERSIGIQGPLSLNALRKFGSLIKTPAPHPEAANLDNYQSQSVTSRSQDASLRYFKTVKQLLADLKSEKGTTKGLAGWYDNFAGQIDNLPILNVDPALISFAAATSEHLRALAASLKGIVVQSGNLQKQKNWGSYSYNPYSGYYGYYCSTAPAYLEQQQLVAQGAEARVALWERVDNETAEVRRQMTQKYSTEF